MTEKHEDKVCNTLVQFIEKRKGVSINRIDFPDKNKINNEPSVDRLIRCVGLEIVLEHTLIESYPDQIAEHHMIKELLGPVKSQVDGQLPIPGHYDLSIALGAVKGAKDTQNIQKALITWIKKRAPSLQVGSPDVAPYHYITEKPPGVPFEVTLYRWPSNESKFYFSLLVPDDIEAKRAQRIREALEKKCPKLHKARGNDRISILLIEADDISLGNHLQIWKALKDGLILRNDVPDDIYLVMTELDEWCVWVLKEEAKLFRDIENCGPYYLHAAT